MSDLVILVILHDYDHYHGGKCQIQLPMAPKVYEISLF